MAIDGEHPTGSAAELFEQLLQRASYAPNSAAVQNPTSDQAISAVMSVPHYPDVAPNRTRISVSDIINAVVEPRGYQHPQSSSSQEVAASQTSPQMEIYNSDSEMTDALSEVGGVSLDGYGMEQMGMTGLSRQSFDDALSHQSDLAPSETSEEDSEMDQVMEDDEPSEPRPEQIPVSTLDDDEMRKFYLDFGNDDSDGGSRISSDNGPSHVSDVDLDDFYRAPGYTYGSQISGFDPPSSHEDHNNFFSDIEENNADPVVDPHLADSVIHGTSALSSILA